MRPMQLLCVQCNGDSDFVLAKAAAAWLRVLREFSDSLAHLTFCLAGVLSSPNGIQGDSRPDIEALNEYWTNVETVAETIQTRLRGLDMDAEHWAPLKPRLDNAHDIVSTFQGQVCTAVSNCVQALTNDYPPNWDRHLRLEEKIIALIYGLTEEQKRHDRHRSIVESALNSMIVEARATSRELLSLEGNVNQGHAQLVQMLKNLESRFTGHS